MINIDGAAGWVAIFLPLAILVVIVVGVIVGRDRTAVEVPELELATATAGTPEPVQADFQVPTELARSHAPVVEATVVPTPATMPSPASTPPEAGQPWRTDQKPAARDADYGHAISRGEALLAQAEQRFDDAAVARLSYELACTISAAQGPSREAQTHLRRAIILATRLNDNETHAAARLELGDHLASEGDMTTACEHWQIARQIYWDASEKAALADVDRRMIDNGCPTDWVLNDF